jgi:hypothetical protein
MDPRPVAGSLSLGLRPTGASHKHAAPPVLCCWGFDLVGGAALIGSANLESRASLCVLWHGFRGDGWPHLWGGSCAASTWPGELSRCSPWASGLGSVRCS